MDLAIYLSKRRREVNIKVLGSGCQNCKRLYENTKEAVHDLKIEADIEYVTDFMEIAKYNLLRTPGLVINQKVVSYGKVCTKEEIVEFIQRVFKYENIIF